MKNTALTGVCAFVLLASTAVFAADQSCEAQAAEKKLSGAAKTSFVKKCQKDATEAATKACEGQASDKKLAGAAKTSFLKKCVKDSAGS